MFFVAAALLLTTAGVFAGKAKFDISSAVLYAKNASSTAKPIVTTTVTLINASTTGTHQALVNDNSNVSYGLYSDAACTQPIYFTGF